MTRADLLFWFPHIWMLLVAALTLFIARETAREEASQVRGRAPGLSEHAAPFGQTEARAERTLDPPRPQTASAGEGGAAPPPRAPEPPGGKGGMTRAKPLVLTR